VNNRNKIKPFEFSFSRADRCGNIKIILKARIYRIAGKGEIFKSAGVSNMDGFRNPITKIATGKMTDGRNAASEIVLCILEL